MLVLYVSYHYMDEFGYHDVNTDHTIYVRPTLMGIQISVCGKNKNFIKGYIKDAFDNFLNEDSLYRVQPL